MKLNAKPKGGKVHLTVGNTTYALKPNDAIKLANQIGTAANDAAGNTWAEHANNLSDIMNNLYKK